MFFMGHSSHSASWSKGVTISSSCVVFMLLFVKSGLATILRGLVRKMPPCALCCLMSSDIHRHWLWEGSSSKKQLEPHRYLSVLIWVQLWANSFGRQPSFFISKILVYVYFSDFQPVCHRQAHGMPQEFLKHAVPDYLVRDTALFSLRLSSKRNDNR